MGRKPSDGARPHPRPRRRSVDDTRRRALEALLAVHAGAGAQAVIREALDRQPALAGPDRGLLTELVYSTLRRQRSLDAWIAASSSRGLFALEAPVLAALRLGALQIADLDRIPDHAAVNATVDSARELIGERAVGFVHAILRQLGRRNAAGDGPGQRDLPDWIDYRIVRLADVVGVDADALCAAFRGPAPLHVHGLADVADLVDTLQADQVVARPIAGVPRSAEIMEGQFFDSRAFAERQVLAQDGGSAAVAEWLGARHGEQVVEVGAGRGAKSLVLAAAGALVTAIDRDADRLAEAMSLAEQAGHPLHDRICCDAAVDIPSADGSFDRALLDAPCSGLGTLRRRPEIRHRRRATDLVRAAGTQAALLEQTARLVRVGGVLVYAVCSFAEEEGVMIVDDFLASHPEFARAPREEDGGLDWATPWLDTRGDLRTHPLIDDMDAFYAARLQRSA